MSRRALTRPRVYDGEVRFVAQLRNASIVLEAAYDVGSSDAGWLRRLLRAVSADMDGGLGLYALTVDLARDDFAFVTPPMFHRLASDIREIAPALAKTAPRAVAEHFRSHVVEFGSVSQLFGSSARATVRRHELPFVDSVGLSVQDGEGTGLQIISPMVDVVRVHGRSRAAWRKLGLHLGIAWRLRKRLARGGCPEALVEKGKVVDARGIAKERSARAALIEATRRIERARADAASSEPERVLELWQGLVSGRWSLVDKWDSDGRRYVAAYPNGATVGNVDGLGPTELRILHMYLLRASPGEIAFALGFSRSTVERVLSSAAKRLGLRSRAELVRLAQLGGVARVALDVGGDRIDVLRFEQPRLSASLEHRLTKAQLEVATAAGHGLSDGEIARVRGSSVRTVSNLLAATYRALGISGREDLVRLASEHAPGVFPG